MLDQGHDWGLKEARDWVIEHWKEVFPNAHVELYNEDESLTHDGTRLYQIAETDLTYLIGRLTEHGEVTINEAVALIHQAIGTTGARLILQHRREAQRPKP